MENVVNIAFAEVGIKETKGKAASPRIMQYAKEAGFPNYKSDEQAWCALFVNWVAHKAGLQGSGKLSARSFLNVGLPVENPEPGDVVVFWRESIDSWKGHVGFFTGFSTDKSRVFCLGGNQNNQVSVTAKPISKVLGYRRLVPVGSVVFANKDLEKGDTGPDVMKLQDALKRLGYDPGTSDGIFGERTEAALKLFQTSFFWEVDITGVFDKETRDFLTELLKNNS